VAHGDTAAHKDIVAHGDIAAHRDLLAVGDIAAHGDILAHGVMVAHINIGSWRSSGSRKHCALWGYGGPWRYDG
jgi:hypothetical protein